MSGPYASTEVHVFELRATRLLVALWGGLALLDVLHVLGAAPVVQLAGVVALVAGCSLGVSRTVAVGVAGIGWLLLNGFVVHEYGQLGFVGFGDVARVVLLLGVALTVAGLRR